MRAVAAPQRALGWLVAASLAGFAVPAVFSWTLRWSRSAFLLPYALVVIALVLSYLRSHPPVRQRWTARPLQALVATVVAVLLLSRNIAGQPVSAVPQGLDLVAALAWAGWVYGSVDALLLNVLPVLVVGGPPHEAGGPVRRRVLQASLALLASLLVTVAYHAGFTEFHGTRILYAVIGNAIITGAYLASGNPLAAVVPHVAMHMLAVLHGMETTLQLPPHYGG